MNERTVDFPPPSPKVDKASLHEFLPKTTLFGGRGNFKGSLQFNDHDCTYVPFCPYKCHTEPL